MKKTAATRVQHSGRHLFLMQFSRYIIAPFIGLIMGYRYKRTKGPLEPGFIISNHNSNIDPVLVMMGFTGHAYFVASEHAFRKGFPSKLMSFVFDPIYINKAQADSYTLKEMFRRIKAGFSICLFAEGNRSFNGQTGDIVFSTAKMVKLSGAALITYRLEGVYFTTPRWGTSIRRGRCSGGVTSSYSAEEIKNMSVEQIYESIVNGISEDAYARQKESPVIFKGKNPAEYIETILYLCPFCKKPGTIHSKRDEFFCSCGMKGKYTATAFLEGEKLPFTTITEWDKWQKEELSALIEKAGDGEICTDEDQALFKVSAATGEEAAGTGPMSISRKEFRCAGMVFLMEDIKQFAIVGMMTLTFALKDGRQYEVRSAVPRSAVKYLDIYKMIKE